MSYTVTRSFYEGSTLHESGQEFSHNDAAFIQKCLDDGNIAESTNDGGSSSAAPLVQPPVVLDSPSELVVQAPTQPSEAQRMAGLQNQGVQPTPIQVARDIQL